MRKQSGFAAIELVLVLVIVAAIGGIGYYATHKHSQANQQSVATSASQPAPVSTPVAPQITTASDLNTAMQALNQTQVGANNTDSSQLNTQVSGF